MSAPTVRTARDVADLRVWMRDEWAPDRLFGRVATRIAEDGTWPGLKRSEASRWARWEQSTFAASTLWWVSEDMVDLLLASARAVPDDVMLDDVQAPSPAGFVVFAKPWYGLDSLGGTQPCRVDAFIWGGAVLPPDIRPTTRSGVTDFANTDSVIGRDGHPEGLRVTSISTYRKLNFDDGLTSDDMRSPIMGDVVQAAASVTPVGGNTYALHGDTWSPLGRSDWPLNDKLSDRAYDMPDAMHASYVEDRRVLVALWTLLHQEGIAQTTVEHIDRPARRRAQRAGIDPELAKVRVVTLRRLHRTESAPSDEAGHVEWSHRWLVTGHWRWQRVGPGRSQRRLTFVRPYVKGPDDKELVVPEQVNAWVR